MSKNLRLILRYSGLGLLTAGAISRIYKGFNYTILGLYILGGIISY